MSNDALFILGILSLIGLSLIAGVLTRGDEKWDIMNTILRGLAVIAVVAIVLGMVGGIVYLIVTLL